MFNFIRRRNHYPVNPGRRIEGPPRSGEIPITIEEETRIIRQVISYRPGDYLPIDLVAKLPKPDPDSGIGGYLSVGLFWPGPELLLSSDFQIEKMTFGMPKLRCMIDGMRHGMSVENLKRIYPDLSMVAEWELVVGSGNFFRQYEASFRQKWRILANEHQGHLERFELIRIGYDGQREKEIEARKADRESEAMALRETATARDDPRMVDHESDKMLREWAADGSKAQREIAERLLNSSIAEWADIIDDINWDFGLEPIFWIVRQSQIHPESLFEIFILSEPDYFCNPENQSDDYVRPELKLLLEMRDRLNSDFYILKAPFDGVAAWDNRCALLEQSYMTPWRQVLRRKFP